MKRAASKKNGEGAAAGKTCPVCGRPADACHRPFCSRRCADLDLGRWLNEDYRIPTEETPADGGPSGDLGEDGDKEPR